MTARTTFGDLAGDAVRHLQQPVPRDTHVEDVAAGLRTVITAMMRHSAAIDAVLHQPGRPQPWPWLNAATRAQDALEQALTCLPPAPASAASSPVASGHSASPPGNLHAAALSIILARDLLLTHLASLPDGTRTGHSDWAPVVTSPALARALLYEVAGWARHAAATASQAAVAGIASTSEARRDLAAACQWLWQADQAITGAHRGQPVTGAEQQLLRSVPVNRVPDRLVLVGGEPVGQICRGIIDTAERAREAARAAIPHAAWSPALTRESLRETAAHCVVTAWNCRIVLETLGTIAARAVALPAPVRPQLARAASAVSDAGAAWLAAAGQWDVITTDTRPRSPHALSHAATAATDLALWTGRLAYADHAWTPQQGPSSPPRSPESLVPRSGDLHRVVTAVHHACHAMTRLAHASEAQLRTAARASRLVVPVRSLPERYDIARIYAHAPPERVTPLLAAYHQVPAASERATAAIDTIAITIRAPSQALAAARAAQAAAGQQPAWHDAAPAAPPHPALHQPGPVERILRDLDVTSPADLRRAAAIDKEADELILRAAHRNPYPQPGWDLATSAGTAELIHHAIATGDPQAAALIHPPTPSRQPEAEIEP